MDATDSEQGQEKPSEQSLDLTLSSRGRQRKANSKYSDYEVDFGLSSENSNKKRGRKSSGEEPTSIKTPAKRRRPKNTTGKKVDGEPEPSDTVPQDCVEKISKKTPKKTVRGRKTPSKRTPAKKSPTKDGDVPAAEGEGVGTVQQENGTPKPKRKYVRKRTVQQVELVTNPACEISPAEAPIQPEEEIGAGGRPKRGAAKAALRYFHTLAQEVFNQPGDEPDSQPAANGEAVNTESEAHQGSAQKTPKGSKGPGRRGRKRKNPEFNSEAEADEDFVPDAEEEEEEEEDVVEVEEVDELEDSDLDLELGKSGRSPATLRVKSIHSAALDPNGLTSTCMKTVCDYTVTNKKFREEHYSTWVFPDWVPSTSAWHLVPQSDLEKYLPQELESAAFRVSREGLKKEETPLQRLGRFGALPAHPERWDMFLCAGGPVWAMEWCPTPDGAPATQYIALACHRGMDDLHHVSKTYSGPGLVQLWEVGQLEYGKRPDSQPSLVYGLAQDKGLIWQLKWCPAGAWEIPSCSRKAPFLPRLGLLAVASSTSVVTIYSLPHPDALRRSCNRPVSENSSKVPPIYKVKAVLSLKLGSFKSPRNTQSGQVLSMDWLPQKPHNVMAVGFYDGTVGLWDLTTKSSLLRLRESDGSLSLLPYRCFLAHDHAVRALSFCPASRHLIVTAGEDRLLKTWDLRRLYEPITVQKRYLTNEVYWPLNMSGLLIAQENAYAVHGLHGVHFYDYNMRAIFAIPRTATLWSISTSDWLNCVVTSDTLGEVILSVLPQFIFKRPLERRFPVYFTSVVPLEEEVVQDVEREEQQQETEGPGAESEGGNEKNNESIGGRKGKGPYLQFKNYKQAAKKYYLQLTDYDMRTFTNSVKRAVWKRMKDTEAKTKLNVDEFPLAALHKVRFNPNMNCHPWLVSGGQSGLVRLNCLRSFITSNGKKMIREHQTQFNNLYASQDQSQVTQTVTDPL